MKRDRLQTTMARLWPACKWIWLTLIGGIGMGLLFAPLRERILSWLVSNHGFVYAAIAVLLFVALSIASFIAHRREQRRRLLADNFDICVDSDQLTPEMFGYRRLDAWGLSL